MELFESITLDDYYNDKEICKQITIFFENESIESFDPNHVDINKLWRFLIVGFSASNDIMDERKDRSEKYNYEEYDNTIKYILDKLDVSAQNTRVLSQVCPYDNCTLLMRFTTRNRISAHSIKLLVLKHKVDVFVTCSTEDKDYTNKNAMYMLFRTLKNTTSQKYKFKISRKIYTFLKVCLIRRINVQALCKDIKELVDLPEIQSVLNHEDAAQTKELLQRLKLI